MEAGGVARRRIALAAALGVALVVALALWAFDRGPEPGPAAAPPTSPPAAQAVLAGTVLHARCSPVGTGTFTPETISIARISSGSPVLALPRGAGNVPGTPPLTTSGKNAFAWDEPPGFRPGSTHGNVLLNAHTWPDGSALGNRLLAGLDVGDRLVVRGEGHRLCYQVRRKVEVLASKGYPDYYRDAGRPRLALIVCSGQRLGPGVWTHRTIWFATPVTAQS